MRTPLLLLALLVAAPAQAATFCGTMLMPPAQLRQISRGFSTYHSGIDLMAPLGSPIRAAAGGTVVYAGWYFAYGRIVDVQHADGVITRYGHMSGFAPGIARGAPIYAGQVIGTVGMTGRAHGPHVHFEVRLAGHPVDPKPYLGLAACPTEPALPPVEEAIAAPDRRDH
jgi:murein DD-endopeptidase MepM/ murein hydrolase activator NlpD